MAGARGQTNDGKRVVDVASSNALPADAGVKSQNFARTQPVGKAKELGQIAQPPPRARIVQAMPEHAAGAGRGVSQTGEQFERGRFSGAVRTQKPEDFTMSDRKREIRDCNQISVAFRKPMNVDDVIANHLRRPSRRPSKPDRRPRRSCRFAAKRRRRQGRCCRRPLTLARRSRLRAARSACR